MNGVNLFPANQRADSRPQNEQDNRDEYWRQNFINYDSWRKEDQAIHKNKKVPRQPSKSKLITTEMREEAVENGDILPQLQEPSPVREPGKDAQPGIIDLEIIQEYQRKKWQPKSRLSMPKPVPHYGPASVG